MELQKSIRDELVVTPGEAADLHHRPTSWKGPKKFTELAKADRKELVDESLEDFRTQLATAQDLLYASDRYSLLLVFQALDAAGKDGTIKHVMSGVNPHGCQVFSFKQPSVEELDHDFLWRCSKDLPERGRIGIFNRSYYEEVLVVRVHPDFLGAQHLPPTTEVDHGFWKQRFESINAWEQHLDRNGTKILKFFLHVSKDEQKRRFLERLDDPAKHWKFSEADMAERRRWGDYAKAYEEALTATSTSWAPWYVIPADHKHVMRGLVAGIIVHEISRLDLRYPEVGDDQLAAIEAARAELLAE